MVSPKKISKNYTQNKKKGNKMVHYKKSTTKQNSVMKKIRDKNL